MKPLALTAALLAFACAVTIALAQDESAPKPKPAVKELSQAEKDALATQAYFVLRNRCWGCHGEPGKKAYGETVPLDWILDYDKLVEAKLVIPGKVKESRLVYLTTLGKMPREFDAQGKPTKEGELSQFDYKALVEWVKAGAPKWPEMKFTHEWVPLAGPALEVNFDPNLTRRLVTFSVVKGRSFVLARDSNRQWSEELSVLEQQSDGWQQVGTSFKLGVADDAFLLAGEPLTLVRQTSKEVLRESVETQIDEWNGEAWVSVVGPAEPRPARPGRLARSAAGSILMLAGHKDSDEHSSLWQLDTKAKTWRLIRERTDEGKHAHLVATIDGACRSVSVLGQVFEYDKEGKLTLIREEISPFLVTDCCKGDKAGALLAATMTLKTGDMSVTLRKFEAGAWKTLQVWPVNREYEPLLSWDQTSERVLGLHRQTQSDFDRTVWALIPWRQ
ncbi:MAG: hypothetical protein KF754_00350 [Planctomycetes bacterium]|nr:hypothetical protein [Planctomycetota bacterium]